LFGTDAACRPVLPLGRAWGGPRRPRHEAARRHGGLGRAGPGPACPGGQLSTVSRAEMISGTSVGLAWLGATSIQRMTPAVSTTATVTIGRV